MIPREDKLLNFSTGVRLGLAIVVSLMARRAQELYKRVKSQMAGLASYTSRAETRNGMWCVAA